MCVTVICGEVKTTDVIGNVFNPCVSTRFISGASDRLHTEWICACCYQNGVFLCLSRVGSWFDNTVSVLFPVGMIGLVCSACLLRVAALFLSWLTYLRNRPVRLLSFPQWRRTYNSQGFCWKCSCWCCFISPQSEDRIPSALTDLWFPHCDTNGSVRWGFGLFDGVLPA